MEIKEIIEYWKPKLGLQSWAIAASFVPRWELGDNSATASIQSQLEKVVIKIRRIEDRDETDDPVEMDIIHELVHIRLWSIDPYDAEGTLHTCREVAVEWLARALYNERHGGGA